MELYSGEAPVAYPLNDLDNLLPTRAFPDQLPTRALPELPPTTLEASNFFDTGPSNPALSCTFQNIVNMADFFAGILTKALSTMIGQAVVEQNAENGGHMAVDQAVRKLMDQLLPILCVSILFRPASDSC
jgi:hypothetical protein